MFNIGEKVQIKFDNTLGVVIGVHNNDKENGYDVFINGKTVLLYESQLTHYNENNSSMNVMEISSYLTSTLLKNQTSSALYSLNSAKIDYVPYQFRPILKLIKSDMPRILIADGVGVGKTIESGLIIKELEARSNIKSVLIICPKPLITEEKWSSEMKRFDYSFINLDGNLLNYCIDECDKDGEWPQQYEKCVIPYSLLDEELVFGNPNNKKKKCLLDLDPFPKFDLVIVDEAHHIRNSDTQRYNAAKMFIDNAENVVLLTATPLQLGDKDLYTLLQLLRPDLILDYDSFKKMSEPNPYINKAITLIRNNGEQWQAEALSNLQDASLTEFGLNTIQKNPLYTKAYNLLNKGSLTKEERVELISCLEGLHTFSTIINRTRRRDIGNFTIRKPEAVVSSFNNYEKVLYEEFVTLVSEMLEVMYDNIPLKFLMCTLLRQASSSLHAIAPFMKYILNGKLSKLLGTSDLITFDNETSEATLSKLVDKFKIKILEIIKLAENLPTEDDKLNKLIDIVCQKQKLENNKVMVFSSFIHTLEYLKQNLEDRNIRVAMIHGAVPDDERVKFRDRFKLNKEADNAIDVLLFSDVGCEGLDYQFCDCMVNFDLPWNPQRIEQRIGRIDRKGQQSESVLIYNMLVEDTIDIDIYERCLLRIGVFNSEIGDSEVIIGNISKEITNISLKYLLNPDESKHKLQQLADNQIRLINEQRIMEDNQYSFFGLDLMDSKNNKDIENSKNIFLSAEAIKRLVDNYLMKVLKVENSVIGNSTEKILKLSQENRIKLFEDYLKINRERNKIYKEWENYLKGNDPFLEISFNGEFVSENEDCVFINASHPLVKQALYNIVSNNTICNLKVSSKVIKPGIYPFAIYLWSYKGFSNNNILKPITNCNCSDEEFLNLIFNSVDCELLSDCESLDNLHYDKWLKEKEKFINEMKVIIDFKKENLKDVNNRQNIALKKLIINQTDEKIIKMKKAELENINIKFNDNLFKLEESIKKLDLVSTLLIKGNILVEE